MLRGLAYGFAPHRRHGSGGYYIASDIPAFVNHTRTVQYIDDGKEKVKADGETITFRDIATGGAAEAQIKITWTVEQSEKGDFAHFMLKEIMDQKEEHRPCRQPRHWTDHDHRQAIRTQKGHIPRGMRHRA